MSDKLYFRADDIPQRYIDYLVEWGRGAMDRELAGLVLASFSIGFAEKWRIFAEELSSFQRDELIKVFKDEQKKFFELSVEHPLDLMNLVAKEVCIMFIFATYMGLESSPTEEAAFCRKITSKAIDETVENVLNTLKKEEWQQNGEAFVYLWRHAMPESHFCWELYPGLDGIPETI